MKTTTRHRAINDGFRLNAPPRRRVLLAADGEAALIDADTPDADEAPFPLIADLSPRRFAVTSGGDTFLVTIPEFSADAEAALGGNAVKAPMPGKVLSVAAKPGAQVARGDVLAVLEAMKMEHALSAPATASSSRSTPPPASRSPKANCSSR